MKKTFRDHAGKGLENFDDLDLWLWAVETENWGALDRLMLRRGDTPMTPEARDRLAGLLRARRPRGRPKTDTEQMWQLADRLMRKARKTMNVSDSAVVVSKKLRRFVWRRTPKQIEDWWRKGKRSTPKKS